MMKLVRYMKRNQKDEAGFTLIELMVVIVVLGILAALVLPRVIGTVTQDARENANKANQQMLQNALDRAQADTGSTSITLDELASKDGPEGWKGPYIASKVKPPQGYSEYSIDSSGNVTNEKTGGSSSSDNSANDSSSNSTNNSTNNSGSDNSGQ